MQTPSAGRLNIDHVAHFVPDAAACRDALVRLGFTPTPFSLQQHRTRPEAALTPVGTGNHCVMLGQGYLEFLVPVADTEVAAQLRRMIERHVGPHSIVFGSADPTADHARLRREGFDPLPPIALQRPIDTPAGEQTVRFSVVRVPPGTMPEGRIQFCQHHSEALMWQPRWLTHANGAVGLAGVFVCADDAAEAAARYARFTGLPVSRSPAGVHSIQTERGWIRFHDRRSLEEALGAAAPVTPIIAGWELHTRDPVATRRVLEANAVAVRSLDGGKIAVSAPAAIGGEIVFSPV